MKARKKLAAKKGPKRKTRINPINRKRKAKMYERNFAGDQTVRKGDKAEWIRGCPCAVTGRWPVDAAHVLGDRGMGGAGGDATGLVPLHRIVHEDFGGQSLPYVDDEAFALKWGITRAAIRKLAAKYDKLWVEHGPDATVEGMSF